jgi:hypothetical protein
MIVITARERMTGTRERMRRWRSKRGEYRQ